MEPTADITPPSPHHDPLIPDDGQGLLPILLGNPDYIPAEVSLETIGYFTPSSKRIKHILTKEKILTEKLGPDGVKVALKVAIIASGKYGLPNTSDLDYHRGFLKFLDELVEEAGDIPEPLRLPAKPIIRYAGKTIRGGKAATRLTHSKKTGKPITVTHNPTIEEFKDWIRRGHHTGITGYLYDAATGDYVEVGDEPLFRKYRLRGQLMENGQLAETNYVWLASWFRANYHRYRRTIDFALHRRLRKPIAKSLYPLLETGWYASKGQPYHKYYPDLCKEFLLTQCRYLADIKKQLDPAHRELQAQHYLHRWEYHPAADRSSFVITWYPGHKFGEDQHAAEERRHRAQQLGKRTSEMPSLSPLGGLEEALLEEIIAFCGDAQNRPAYERKLRTHGEYLMPATLSETRMADRLGTIKQSRAQYFMDMIKRLAEARQQAKQQERLT